MKTYVTNTFSPLMIGQGIAKVRPCSEKEVQSKLTKLSWESAISHEVTANYLSRRMGYEIPFRRKDLKLVHGDNVLVCCPQFRGDKAREFTQDEIKNSQWKFFWVMVR